MIDAQILIILFINFLLIITLVVILIRFASKKFKEQQDDIKDRLADIEEKYTKLDVQFSRVLSLHVSQQVADLEKPKVLLQNTTKKVKKSK
ncbi:MAG: hypothetical protein WCX82_04335 [archaeon]|jgi:hypothetical protein